VAEVVTYMSVVMPYAVGGRSYSVQTKAGLELKCELVRLQSLGQLGLDCIHPESALRS